MTWAGVEDRWPDRLALMATFVPPCSRVVDVGAGAEQLKEYLPDGCTYYPVDQVARSPRTIVRDLDANIPLPRADVVVGAGILEYLHNAEGFLKRCRHAAPLLILSYARSRYNDVHWVNRFTSEELEAMARSAGFKTWERVASWEGQVIWRGTR